MNTFYNSQLADAIAAYLAIHDPKHPFVVDGQPHTGMKSIFKKTARELGLHPYALEKGLQETCCAYSDILWSYCSTPDRFVLDYEIANRYVRDNHRPVIIIKTAIGTLEDYEKHFKEPFGAAYAVNYELTVSGWLLWGEEIIGINNPHPRIHPLVHKFVCDHKDLFMTEEGLWPDQWKTVSDRWYMLDRNVWLHAGEPEDLNNLRFLSLPGGDDKLRDAMDEYLDKIQ